jgi:uncharacterized membrane protein YphA (DoxX/SURF4 family)
MIINNESILLFLRRVILGILFFFQGYDKVFKVKISGVIDFFANETRNTKIPHWTLQTSAYYTSYIEFLCDGMLIIGLFTKFSLYLLGIDMILVVGAFSMIKPMWDMNLLFPSLILLSVLLFLPEKWNTISVDHILHYFTTIYS